MYALYCRSTLAVASSNTRILLFRKRALAKHTNCFCPTLKLQPFSCIFELRPPGNFSMTSLSFACNNNLVIKKKYHIQLKS